MQKVLRGLTPSSVLVYLDDILVLGKTPDDMINKLDMVFHRFRAANLRLHPAKCHWCVDRVKFLGHVFDKNGISLDESKLSVVRDFPRPRTQKHIKSFLGLCNYYRRFVKSFSQISAPMRELLKQDVRFQWTDECENAFKELKTALITAPVLVLPDFKKSFVLTCDASTSGVGYILSQKDEGGREHVICYGGRGLRPNETRWGITDLELLALVEGVKAYHTYLADKPFVVVTDHVSLSYLKTMRFSGNNRQTRWALFLQSYRFSVEYKKGILNTAADAISRMERPVETAIDADQDIDIDANWTEYVPTTTAAIRPEVERQVLVPVKATNATRVDRVNIEFDNGDDETGYVTLIGAIGQLPMLDDVREGQRHCPDFAPLLDYLQHGTLPRTDDAARKVIAQSPDFEVENGILYHIYTPRTRSVNRARAIIKQLCVPTALREAIAVGLHDNNCHPGFDRLYATARTRYYFEGMYTYLKAHVLTCKECQFCKRPIGTHKANLTSLPV